jgi:hypothetical protein
MASPFDDGRVGLMVTDWSLTIPYANVPAYATDLFLPAHTVQLTGGMYDSVKGLAGQRGTKVQWWWDGTHGQSGTAVADAIHASLTAIPQHTGGVEVDLEAGDDVVLKKLLGDFYLRFRALRPTRALALNVVPLKGQFLPLSAMAFDPNVHVRVQTYYGGEMRPADPAECEADIVDRGFPRERYSICYSAKARRQKDDSIFCDLPVFSDGGAYVRKLRKGQIFSLNLMREAGLL